MTIGLDLGSHQFRSIRPDNDQLIARQCPVVFMTLADTPAHRRLLQQSNTCFATCSNQLILFGESASEWSTMLNIPLTPLLRGGRIPESDPIARQILTLMIDAVLPAPRMLRSPCLMTLPSAADDEHLSKRDAEFFQQLVALRGYRPHLVTATQALALAELAGASFTGIVIHFSNATTEFGVVHCGREIIRCVVTCGLDQFDDLPSIEGIDPSKMNATQIEIERDYAQVFADIVMEASHQFENQRTLKTLSQSMPVVCGGGISQIPSFLPMFQKIWNDCHWPVKTQPVRIATDGDWAVARGCLIQAVLDEPSERQVA